MQIKKPLLIAGVASGLALAGLGGVASAATSQNGSEDTLVSRIASTFNLDEAKVQEVVDAEREEREAKHTDKVTTKLDTLVADGKLTEEQKTALLNKRTELRQQMESQRNSMEDTSAEDWKSAKETRRNELKAWADEQGIDTRYLRYVMGHGGHGGPGHAMAKPDDAATRSE